MYVTLYGNVGNPEICVEKIGFLILNAFKMLARFSKYDFWIPEQILDFNIFFRKQIIFLSRRKISRIFRNLENFGKFSKMKTLTLHNFPKYMYFKSFS